MVIINIISIYYVLNKAMQSKSSGTMSEKFNYQQISFSCHYAAQWSFDWSSAARLAFTASDIWVTFVSKDFAQTMIKL